MWEMLVQITPHDVCYLQPPYDRYVRTLTYTYYVRTYKACQFAYVFTYMLVAAKSVHKNGLV